MMAGQAVMPQEKVRTRAMVQQVGEILGRHERRDGVHDLAGAQHGGGGALDVLHRPRLVDGGRGTEQVDRKSTRLNSSHVKTSYAVFCVKKKMAPRRRIPH